MKLLRKNKQNKNVFRQTLGKIRIFDTNFGKSETLEKT